VLAPLIILQRFTRLLPFKRLLTHIVIERISLAVGAGSSSFDLLSDSSSPLMLHIAFSFFLSGQLLSLFSPLPHDVRLPRLSQVVAARTRLLLEIVLFSDVLLWRRHCRLYFRLLWLLHNNWCSLNFFHLHFLLF